MIPKVGCYHQAMKSMMTILGVVGVLMVTGCTTTGDASGSWSRSYVSQRDRVIEAAVEVLEDENYVVDVNHDAGRIDASPSRSAGGGRATLVVRIVEKSGRVRVDVQTRSGAGSSGRPGSAVEAQVLEFLHALDLKLKL
jgi:hypothetical protein